MSIYIDIFLLIFDFLGRGACVSSCGSSRYWQHCSCAVRSDIESITSSVQVCGHRIPNFFFFSFFFSGFVLCVSDVVSDSGGGNFDDPAKWSGGGKIPCY